MKKELSNFIQTLYFNIKREGIAFTLKCMPYHFKMRLVELRRSYDKQHGMDTSATALVKHLTTIGNHTEFASAYSPSLSCQFKKMMRSIPISYDEFVFIDLGSGKGRALFLAAEYSFKKIIGVEFCKELHDIALRNVALYQHSNNKKDFELNLIDAAEYIFPPDNLFIYLFNPFDKNVLSLAISNLLKHCSNKNRRIIIAYYHPIFYKVIENAGFQLIQERKQKNFLYGWKIYERRV